MAKSYIKVIFLVLIALFLPLKGIFAQNGILVQFSPDPLFNAANFLPGDSLTGQIRVDNNTGQQVSIYMWTKNVIDNGHLGNVLSLIITKNGTQLYHNHLANLFSENSVLLSSIDAGTQALYQIVLSFDSEAGNEYQNKSLQFDFNIGIESQDQGSGGGGDGGSSTTITVGSGGGVFLPTLRICNLRAENIKEQSAVIKWQTNLLSTSQVIYSPENKAHQFNPSLAPLYGYSFSSPNREDTTKVLSHSVLLSNLSACTTYYFKAVSHNSSLAISEEKTFTTLCPQSSSSQQQNTTAPPSTSSTSSRPVNFQPSSGGGVNSASHQKVETEKNHSQQTQQTSNQNQSQHPKTFSAEAGQTGEGKIQPGFLSSLLANIGSIFRVNKTGRGGWGCLSWWIILLLGLYSMQRFYSAFQKSKKQKESRLFYRKRAIIWLGWALCLSILFILSLYFCLPWALFLILLLATFLIFLLLKSKPHKQNQQTKSKQENVIPLPASNN